MRMTHAQAQITKETMDRILGAPNRVWLFGSRANDDQVGGDIDLLIETEAILQIVCRRPVSFMSNKSKIS